MKFTIRPANAADIEDLARLHVETWRETYQTLLPDIFFGEKALAHRRQMWTRALVDEPDPSQILVVAVSEGLVGFAWAGPTVPDLDGAPTDRQLYAIYVRASHHGLGIGQHLLDEVVGSGPASLWVARDNPRARRFYERNGFEADGTEKPDDRVPTFWELRMVRMSKEPQDHHPATDSTGGP